MSNLWKPAALAAYCNQGRSGSSLVDSGMRYADATLQKPGSWSQIAGHRDRWALELDGTQYGSVANASLGWTSNLTITAWVYVPSLGLARNVCGSRGSGGFNFEINPNGVRFIGYSTGTTVRSIAYDGDSWHHVAARCTATTTTIFWNGLQVGAVSGFGLVALSSETMRIGAGSGSGDTVTSPFVGKIADMIFWPGNLADDDIAWLANPANNPVQVPAVNRGFPMSRLVN